MLPVFHPWGLADGQFSPHIIAQLEGNQWISILQIGMSTKIPSSHLKTKTLPLLVRSAKELCSHVEMLPSEPTSKFKIAPTTHPTKQPVHLYYHNSLNCVEALFNNPLLPVRWIFPHTACSLLWNNLYDCTQSGWVATAHGNCRYELQYFSYTQTTNTSVPSLVKDLSQWHTLWCHPDLWQNAHYQYVWR